MPETTITSARPCMLWSDSRTNGNGGTSLTVSLIARFTATLHSKRVGEVNVARECEGRLERWVGKLGPALDPLAQTCQRRKMRPPGQAPRGRPARRSIVRTNPGKRLIPRQRE